MTEELVLDAVDQRVLGSLLEKQVTVPASYPMTLNSLRTACNQTSSRDPVVDYDEPMLLERMKTLKERGLVRIVWADRGPRTLKYHQLLDERLGLQPDERALLTVLLLRGAQAPGELRSRTERLHRFADRDEVEEVLRRMADQTNDQTSERPTPLVRELERRPGQQDRRWVHLLGPVEAEAAAPALPPAVDSESVLAEGATARDAKVRATYDAVATAYADRLGDELDRKPFDRWLLDRVAGLADGSPVVDVGTGPGHVAAYLAAAGADATGVDLSPGMVEEARTPLSRPDLQRRKPDQPASTARGVGLGRHHGVVRPGAPGRFGALPGRRLPRPRARPGRLARPRPARRHRRAPRGRADGPAGGRRLRAARPGRLCSPPCAPPAWSTSSGTCAVRTPAQRSRPSGSTCSARRPDH